MVTIAAAGSELPYCCIPRFPSVTHMSRNTPPLYFPHCSWTVESGDHQVLSKTRCESGYTGHFLSKNRVEQSQIAVPKARDKAT